MPDDEKARLAALREYNVLDSLPEEAFDDLTFLASQLCDTPISLVTFIDYDRHWFKSKRGLNLAETPRDLGFCNYATTHPDDLLIVPDTTKDKRFVRNPYVTGEPQVRFYAGAALVTPNGFVIGTLSVLDQQPRELTDMQRQALRALARQVMAQLELKRNLIQLATEMTMRVKTEIALRDSEEMFRAFMENIPFVAFVKDAEGRYSYVNRQFLKRVKLPLNRVLGADDFTLWPNTAPLLREQDQNVLASDATISVIDSVPMEDGRNQVWQTYKFPLQRRTQGSVGKGRFLAGIAIDITETKRFENQLQEYQQRLEEVLSKVKAQSMTDGLTGINNRRAFEHKFEEELSRAARYGLLLSVLMIDVDKFKSYNDSFGHLVGDELLRRVANLLQENARDSDFVARYGGEEFVIILPNTNRRGALLMAERFCSAVANMPAFKRPVTISVGVSTGTSGRLDGAALLGAADKALYRAKQEGRNRVVQG